jgi:hypothetical protein
LGIANARSSGLQLVSGGRRRPLEIETIAESVDGATPGLFEFLARDFDARIEALTQPAGKFGASLGGERQSVFEDLRGRTPHGVDLNNPQLPGKTDQEHVIELLPEPRPTELLTPRGGPRQKAVVVAPVHVPKPRKHFEARRGKLPHDTR